MTWPFAPVCLSRGSRWAIADQGYVEYGSGFGSRASSTVERVAHFSDWGELRTVEDVVEFLCEFV